jgi:hypothetical protein
MMNLIKKYSLAIGTAVMTAFAFVITTILPAKAALTASSGEDMLDEVGGQYFDMFKGFVVIIFTKYLPVVIALVVIASLVGLGYWFIHKITGHK